MDPVSILALTNASFAIARSLVHTIKELYELAEAYETAALGIRTVATQCNSFRIAIQRINTWLTKQSESTRSNLDDDFWQALSDNLETGQLVLEDLEKRISGLKKTPSKFWTRTKYLWNSVVISELQSQIQGLMSAVSILIQVIDIPTTGGKRSQSLAHRDRLNTLTKSVRLTVDQRRERIRNTQEQTLLDDVDSEPPTGLQDPLPLSSTPATTARPAQETIPSTTKPTHNHGSRQSSQDLLSTTSTTEQPPPPYDYYNDDKQETKSRVAAMWSDTKKAPEVNTKDKESSFRVLDSTEIHDEKSKKSKWSWNLKKRSTPKDQPTPKSSSGSQDNNPSKPIPQTEIPPRILGSTDQKVTDLQRTPAAIESPKDDKEYFDLQQAMAGVSLPMDFQGAYSGAASGAGEGVPRNSTKSDSTEGLARIPSIVAPPEGDNTTSIYSTIASDSTPANNPFADPPNVPSGKAATPSYYPPRTDSSDTLMSSPPSTSRSNKSYGAPSTATSFDRIRPSQRVREARERSRSRGPSREEASSPPTSPDNHYHQPLDRASRPQPTSTPSFNTPIHQTWRTTPALAPTSSTLSNSSNSGTLRFRISFDPNSFTTRISTSAARALNVLDSAIDIDNIPIATLTLLYTVDDGETQSVMGDEVEMEVMHEEESRTAEIRFGADQMMLKELMEVGGYLYWSERGVPRGLRTMERLRLFRRFEMSMW